MAAVIRELIIDDRGRILRKFASWGVGMMIAEIDWRETIRIVARKVEYVYVW